MSCEAFLLSNQFMKEGVWMQKEITFHHKEFETTVRHELLILDRPIYDTDLLNLIDLDCSMFKFDDEDYETLMLCENLEFLCIESCALNLNFFHSRRCSCRSRCLRNHRRNYNYSY